jgi:hypothetical protein
MSGQKANTDNSRLTGSPSKYSPSLRSLLYMKKWNDAMERISSNPIEAEAEDRMGDLPLHEVCHLGAPFQVIQKLIHTNKSALQKKGFCGRLPLHYAAYNKPSVNVIKLLLRHHPGGANEVDMDGRLPLHLAVVRNAPKQTLLALIEANPRALVTANSFGNTPAMLARTEHVADLLDEETKRPRGIQKKMQLEKKLLHDVWNSTKKNPVTGKSPTKPARSSKPLRSVDVNAKSHSVRKDAASRYGSSVASPRSPVEVMSKKGKGIPSPEKGSGNFGGKVVMNSHRRSHLPSPSKLSARTIPVGADF